MISIVIIIKLSVVALALTAQNFFFYVNNEIILKSCKYVHTCVILYTYVLNVWYNNEKIVTIYPVIICMYVHTQR